MFAVFVRACVGVCVCVCVYVCMCVCVCVDVCVCERENERRDLYMRGLGACSQSITILPACHITCLLRVFVHMCEH